MARVVDTVFRFNNDSLKCKFSFNSDTTKIFQKTPTAAFYPGGGKGWNEFLQTNLHKVPVNESGENTVWIEFIVRKNGELTNFKILQSHSQAQEEEALSVVKKSHRWLPATANGHCVSAFVKIAIEFK